MTREVLDRAFEPFFTTKPLGQGTGLGLATVQTILQRLRGHLTIDTTLGSGTTVACWLPPTAAPEPSPVHAMDGEPAVERGAGVTTATGTDTTPVVSPLVLVVDDEPMVRGVAQRVLQRGGYTVVTAEDGSHALTLLDEGLTPVLVLTDLMMPHMSGWALSDALQETRPRLPVVFMSGYAREDILAKRPLDRARPLVHKPFSPSVLLDTVRDALRDALQVSAAAPV